MNKDYYKKYYSLERNHWWFRIRNQIIIERLELILPKRNIKILNIGVATGLTSELLTKFGSVTSLEYDNDCCEFLRNELNFDVINGSILELPFKDDSFDLVCAFDVIEHIENDKLGVTEIKRVCKKGGIIYITVPAFQFLWSKHDDVNHHYRRYTMKGICDLFESTKQNLIYKSYFNSLLFLPIAAFRIISRKFYKKRKQISSEESDFEILSNNVVNNFLFRIFKFEKLLLKSIKFPFGVSLIFAQKSNK